LNIHSEDRNIGMHITKELLEKYHRGQCSAPEKAAVEDWLDNDVFLLDEPSEQTYSKNIQQQMWQDIAQHITVPEKRPPANKGKILSFPKIAALAASLLCIGFGAIYFLQNESDCEIVNYTNSNKLTRLSIDQSCYNIMLSGDSKATINLQTGQVDIQGNILFTPKKDLQIKSFTGPGMISLKEGESYILLDNGQNQKQVILSKSELTFLSPALQRHLKQQFDIS